MIADINFRIEFFYAHILLAKKKFKLQKQQFKWALQASNDTDLFYLILIRWG